MGMRGITWPTQTVVAQQYVCGYCGANVAPMTGWKPQRGLMIPNAVVFVCHLCDGPTFIDDDGKQYPGVAFGDAVADINDAGVASLYNEARRTTAASCYTAAVLCCRKILMHVAVAKGATEGGKFIEYVEYLAKSGYIPPDAKDWVDHIRTKSNEANHEIALMSKADAEELMSFTGMLLKLVFEYPAAMKKKISAAAPPAKK
jgi:hypothetical protein